MKRAAAGHKKWAPAIRLALLAIALLPVAAPAKPSQSDVFKSIQDNVGESDGSATKAIPWICAGGGVIIVLALFSKRQTRQAAPKPLNHSGKLLKEILRAIPLKQKELKQIRLVADEIGAADTKKLSSPLVLLLCPSVLEKFVESRNSSSRADRQMLRQVLRKVANR